MVQTQVLDNLPDVKLKVFVVWTPVLREDNRQAAMQAANVFPDERLDHFWDADRSVGNAFGKIVTLPRGRKLAWDVYFAFDGDAEWKDQPPQPVDWMHQLAINERTLDGENLRDIVARLAGAP